jgi:AraC-like DNA-binding protein
MTRLFGDTWELFGDNTPMPSSESDQNLLVPSSYTRIVARELGLQERGLSRVLRGTQLPVSILLPGDNTHIAAAQQMQVLENALRIAGTPEFGLRLGRRLQPASHGPMGYLVLSSPDVISALEAFANFLPLRLPFSRVHITQREGWLTCTLALKIDPQFAVRRVLQECFALMLQAVVESVLGRHLSDARIGLAHPEPDYAHVYGDYFHVPVAFARDENTFEIPSSLAREANIAGHSDAYAVAQNHCLGLLQKMPTAALSTGDRVRRLLLASPIGSLTAHDVAQAMFVTKRTLQRRLDEEGTNYREITETLSCELAARHLLDSDMTIEAVATLLGYYDTAAFRKAFRRWYGQSPSEYRTSTQR